MLNIINTIFKYWFWTDEQYITYTNKKISDNDSFYVFIYLTFVNLKTKKNFDIIKTKRLPLKNLDMAINLEVFTKDEVEKYFNKQPEKDLITLEDIDFDKIPDFVNNYGYGICDVVCELHGLKNDRGQINLYPIVFQETIMTSIAQLADNIIKANPNYKAKMNIYIPEEKSIR
jgi:hypothetical protein